MEKNETNSEHTQYDAIVIGAGHAGAEAGLSLARLGHKTLILTISLDNVSLLACNPSIGGTSKGQIVAEIDALGGEMGINTDKATIQIRMLNLSKGPAVHSLRAQVDKNLYHQEMKKTLETSENLFLKQGEVVEILTSKNCPNGILFNDVAKVGETKEQAETKLGETKEKIVGVKIATGEIFLCKTIVVATGVYLKSTIIMGEYVKNIGPSGFAAANELTESLIKMGIEIKRFKTGTPARIKKQSIDFSGLEVQHGEDDTPNFSELTTTRPQNLADCYLTYTNLGTHKIIKDNIHLAPIYTGSITGIGPRYCPSIETKVVRFEDKERHQLFLEPETLDGQEIYVQGLSTSFSCDLQERIIHSIKGLEKAFVMRNAYAIEYDAINSTELNLSLEHKKIDGLFFAGQVNGTSGYEEAAGQGLIAGINAALKMENKEPLILKRSDAYIGVLIDDLVTKGTEEPYRMMTSRAEYRLLLRQQNADLRLTQKAIDIGLASKERIEKYKNKQSEILQIKTIFEKNVTITEINKILASKNEEKRAEAGIKLSKLVKQSEILIEDILPLFGLDSFSIEAVREVFIESKYEGYIERSREEVLRAKKQEALLLDENLDYTKIKGLKIEAINQLNKIKPQNLGQASRIYGVSPADILVLTIYLKMKNMR